MSSKGPWDFFPVAEALKMPLPCLILALVGIFLAGQQAWRGKWGNFAPVAAMLVIFLITAPARYKTGSRYILVVELLACLLAGAAGAWFWQFAKPRQTAARMFLIVLLSWQVLSTVRARGDFLAYFNELAPRDPSLALVAGCDLDCGQDLFQLRDTLRERQVSHFSLAMWTSADMSQVGLPPFDVLQPFQPVTGWVAVSARARRMGDVFHKTYPPAALAWLHAYQPVVHIGKTILLYNIPSKDSSTPGTSQN